MEPTSTGRDQYTATMYSVLQTAGAGVLNKYTDNDRGEDPIDGITGSLIATGHEALIQVLLAGQPSNITVSEAKHGYFRSGRLDKVVELMWRFPENYNFDIGALVDKLIGTNAQDELILNFAEHLSIDSKSSHTNENNRACLHKVIKSLWKVGRSNIARTIIDRYGGKEKPFLLVVERIAKGEKVSPSDIEEAFETYCPEAPDEKDDDYFTCDGRSRDVVGFLELLEEYDRDMGLIRTAYICHGKKGKIGKMLERISRPDDLQEKVLRKLLEQAEFEKAEELMEYNGMGQYYTETVILAKIAHTIKTGDKENHKNAIQKYEEATKADLERMDEDERKDEEQDVYKKQNRWRARIARYQLKADLLAQQAIFELMYGTADRAKYFIDLMIDMVENIAIPGRKNCEIKHQKTLRSMCRREKRDIREIFHKLGMLHMLPERNKWNSTIQITTEEKIEKRRTKKKSEKRNRITSKNEQEDNKQEASWQEEIKALVREGKPDQAMEALKKQIGGRIADVHDWHRGIMILEGSPAVIQEMDLRRTRLEEILNKHYFGNSWLGRDYDFNGMADFYLAAEKLEIIEEGVTFGLLERWRRNCWSPDGDMQMTKKGMTGLIKGLLRDNKWQRAIKYCKWAEQTGKLSRSTLVECLAILIKSAVENLGNCTTGASQAFRGRGDSSIDAEVTDSVEYWNSQIELIAASQDHETYSEACRELLGKLNSPEAVRTLTRLMALGSIRTHHQKKDILMGAYKLHPAVQEIRLEVVEAMIDNDIPGVEAMPEIKSKETPDEAALMLIGKLVKKNVLHRNTKKYLSSTYLPYIRRLLSQHQNQFNTAMEVMERESNGGENMDEKAWENILEVLGEIGIITPGIYQEAKACKFNKRGLGKIKENLAELRKNIFSNRQIAEGSRSNLLAELVWMAYQPANMSFYTVVHYCERIQDCSHHLAKYTFPENGYQLDLTGNKTMHVRPGQRLSTPQDIYARPEAKVENGISNPYLDSVRNLCKFGRFKLEEVNLNDILVMFEQDEFMKSALSQYGKAKTDNERYLGLRMLQEALGVYLTDNLQAAIKDHLRKGREHTSNLLNGLVESFKKPGKKRAIETQLGIELDESKSDIHLAAQVIAQVIIQKFKPLKGLQKSINDDTKKFSAEEDSETKGANRNLRAVISKNKASFFAKASAGICTADDIDLFNRQDHFHINIIDDEKERCVGNVQAYIMHHEGKPHLLLRGLNPSTNVLKDVDAGSFTEAVIAIGEQFVADNGLEGLILSEQGGFLALSNRPEVTGYVQKKYGDKLVRIDSFKIASHASISAVYAIRTNGAIKRLRRKPDERGNTHSYAA